jgi:hypothetical protein
MPADKHEAGLTLTLSAVERNELLQILEQELENTRVEARRTDSPKFQDGLHGREIAIQGLIDKLRQG